jgi:5-dehydro-2-deoxygluconokinase
MTAPALDVIAIGRSSVDLYGQQVGGRLEDMASFSKAVGGCPANIAIGTARLGLKSALISRVGSEQMGRFIVEQLQREGVETRGVRVDPRRLTALVILGVRDDKTSPMIFYRSDCADAALDESDIDEAFVASASTIVVTGTHFAMPNAAAAQRKAIAIAKRHGRRVAFDIDYRPNLWGLAGHEEGFSRYVRSDNVTRHLQSILPDCDLVVGTEEELHIAGGSENTMDAIRAVRALTKAMIVCKRGPMGCVVFPGLIPADIEDGIKGPGFPVEVYNVLGAGDAFMSGFLRGYVRDEKVETCCAWANAGGAFAVSRLLCSSEYPTWAELQHFLTNGASERALRKDVALTHIHHATTRRTVPEQLRIFSIDHGAHDLDGVARELGADPARLPLFKALAVQAAAQVAGGNTGFGMFLESDIGREALFRAHDHPLWVARQFPHDRVDAFATNPSEWPVVQTVKLIANARSDARTPLATRLPEVERVAAVARAQGREVLIEALPEEGESTAGLLRGLYARGLTPDWWLVEGQDESGWRAAAAAVRDNDPFCHGFIVIARNMESAAETFKFARGEKLVRGFVGGRVIFGDTLRGWLGGQLDDVAAVTDMAARFAALVKMWDAGGSV